MSPNKSAPASKFRPAGLFVTTHWSVVLAAKDKNSPGSVQALETLCQLYWHPVYAFVRGSGYRPEDAEDLTQEFFAQLLDKDYLRRVEPQKGRFRTFLHVAVKRFLIHQWERHQAQKRGGGRAPLCFDTVLAEQYFQEENAHNLSPDAIYDRRWALTLLAEATQRLQHEYQAAAKGEELRHLHPYLTAQRGEIPYAEMAQKLNSSEGAARVAIHRLRKRFRELFREVVADTIARPAELEAELHDILEVLGHA